MEVIYGLIPAMIILGLVMLVVLVWAIKSGQYDDMEGPAHRILMDDDDPLLPNTSSPNMHSAADRREQQSNSVYIRKKTPGKNWPDAE